MDIIIQLVRIYNSGLQYSGFVIPVHKAFDFVDYKSTKIGSEIANPDQREETRAVGIENRPGKIEGSQENDLSGEKIDSKSLKKAEE